MYLCMHMYVAHIVQVHVCMHSACTGICVFNVACVCFFFQLLPLLVCCAHDFSQVSCCNGSLFVANSHETHM